jgi:Caenorhabditis protein of unknown function, DUF268
MRLEKQTARSLSVCRQSILEVVRSSKFLLGVFSAALVVALSIQELPLWGSPKSVDILANGTNNGGTDATAGSRMTIEETQTRLREMGLTPIFNAKTTTDPWKAELFQRLDRIRSVCGLLCQLNTVADVQKYTSPVPDSALSMAQIEPVDCPAILGSEDVDAADSSTPSIPVELKPYFTFDNAIPITNQKPKRTIALGVPKAAVWTEADINQAMAEAKAGTLKGTYGVAATTLFRDTVSDLPIRGKSVMVIGTQKPWIEAILLHLGAAKVTTLEYSHIVSHHAQIQTLQPHEFREQYLAAGTLQHFDGIVSHSSLEHSGLGRYGDALNPWGDVLAVARAWCVTKPGGFLYLGLPTGKDAIVSNWHRVYGRLRWPLVAANWRPWTSNSTGNGQELTRDISQAAQNGGFGYKFTKDSLRD